MKNGKGQTNILDNPKTYSYLYQNRKQPHLHIRSRFQLVRTFLHFGVDFFALYAAPSFYRSCPTVNTYSTDIDRRIFCISLFNKKVTTEKSPKTTIQRFNSWRCVSSLARFLSLFSKSSFDFSIKFFDDGCLFLLLDRDCSQNLNFFETRKIFFQRLNHH